MTSSNTQPVLELRSLSKSFGPVRALTSVSLSLHPGEVVGLVGDNGAGKSTLARIISGTTAPGSGAIFVGGEKRSFSSAHDARVAGIETVYQTLALAPTLNIVENVYLGREMLGSSTFSRLSKSMDKAAMRQKTNEGFRRLGLTLPDLKTKVGVLSGGQRQVVAIARAVLWGSRVVVLDEPTAALGVRQTEIVLSFVERLREHKVAVVYISHNMQHVVRVADRVCVLRLGRNVFDGATSSLSPTDLVSLMTGASLRSAQAPT